MKLTIKYCKSTGLLALVVEIGKVLKFLNALRSVLVCLQAKRVPLACYGWAFCRSLSLHDLAVPFFFWLFRHLSFCIILKVIFFQKGRAMKKKMSGLLAVMLLFCQYCYGENQIIELETLAGFDRSEPRGISSDGSVIIGHCENKNPYEIQQVFWSLDGQVHSLPSELKYVSAISSDGAIFAGRHIDYEACLWSEWSGIVRLGFLPDTNRSTASGISADGTTVWGYCYHTSDSNNWQYFIWTQSSGMTFIAEKGDTLDIAPSFRSFNDDCTVATGRKDRQAFRWTQNGGFELLGTLPAVGKTSNGLILVDGGERIIGTSDYGLWSGVIFDWSASLGMNLMVEPPIGYYCELGDASDDGELLVGSYYNLTDGEGSYGNPGSVAWIWASSIGHMPLKDFVQDYYGLDLSDYHFTHASAVSDDGTIIAVGGYNQLWQSKGWIIILNELVETPPIEQVTIPLVVTSLNLKASEKGKFLLKAIMPEGVTANFGITVQVGDFSAFIDKNDPAWVIKGTKAVFRGPQGGISTIVVDIAKHTIIIAGQNVDLSGLSMPLSVWVELLY
ncbi:MAG: hypothetical protein JXD22_16050 [Sedimentisphaerales bacterium]|nr:hypothetical protein [Sedimentisphaerales bacterium]